MIKNSIILSFFLLISISSFAVVPTLSTLTVDNGNAMADVTFSQNVWTTALSSGALIPGDFTVTISASLSGGTVSAGAVVIGVTHTAGTATATLTFTIAGTPDGSEILTVKPFDGASIWNASGEAMVSTQMITANLNDKLGPTSTASYTKNPLKNGDAQTVTITFGEAVTGTPTITLTGSVTGNIPTGVLTGGPTVWNSIAGTTWPGNETVTVNVGTATDAALNLVNPNPSSNTFVVDNTAPTLSIGAPSATDANNSSSITYTITYTGADAVTLANGNITINPTGGANASVNVTGSGTATRTVTLTNFTGNGTVGISIAAGTASDLAGNTALAAGPSATIAVDNVAPTISIGAPSAVLANNASSITYTVTYSGASAVTLVNGNISINPTGGANATVNVTGVGTTTRTVTLTNFTGNGTVGISIAAGTASDLAGNTALGAGPSATISVDNDPPTISIGAPSATIANNASSITYTITYSGANAVTLANGNITINQTGGANATANVTGSGTTTRTVTLTSFTGNGTVGISIASGTASDVIGNLAAAAGPSATITVDNAPPTPTIGAPSLADTNTGPVSFTITYPGAGNTITLAPGDITLNPTGGASGSVGVSGSGGTTRTVTISSITGNGTLGISIAAGTASDLAGNNALASGPSVTFNVDNIAPTISIGAPSAVLANNASVITYTVTYGGASAVTLANGNVSINQTGGANASVNVTGSGTTTRTVTLTNFTGNGTVGISIAAGTASDLAGNTALGAGPSATISVDNAPPTLSIGAPSLANANSTLNVDYLITYSGANTVNLLAGNVSLTTTGGASGTISVLNGTTNTPTVRISSATGNGTIRINIAAGTASDVIGNLSASAGPSASYNVDNTPPSISIGSPTVPFARNAVPSDFPITYTGASSVNLLAGNISLTTTGGASGTISVLNGTTNTPTVRISAVTGNGTIAINIASGTASDLATNVAGTAGPSATFVVDNIAPTISGSPFIFYNASTNEGVIPGSREVVVFSATEPLAMGFGAGTGTLTGATNSKNITGSGTLFTTELAVGMAIYDNSSSRVVIGVVASISSNTALALVENSAIAMSGTAFSKGIVVQDYNNNSNVGIRVNDGNDDVAITDRRTHYFPSYSPSYTSPVTFTNAVRIIASNNTSKWSHNDPGGITQVSYVAGGNLFDLAGNAFSMTAANVLTGNSTPPAVLPNTMTLFPRSTNPEKIVFTLSSELGQPGFSDLVGTITTSTASANITGVGTAFDTELNVGDQLWTSDILHPIGTILTITNATNLTLTANAQYGISAAPFAKGAVIGTITASTISSTVTGSGTTFLTDLSIGQELWDVTGTSFIGTILSVTNNTTLVLTSVAANAITNGYYTTGIVGFTSTPPANFSAIYSGKGTTNTITLIAQSNLGFTSGSTISYTQVAGNAVGSNGVELLDILNKTLVVEAVAPVITSVSIPNVSMKVNDVVTATIKTLDDDGDNVTLVSGALDNFVLGSLVNVNGTTKTVQFTITEAGTNIAAGVDIPFTTNLVLNDGTIPVNQSLPYSTAISQANDPIDANSPTVLSINRITTVTNGSPSFGTSSPTALFEVAFSEAMQPATLTAADFFISTMGVGIGTITSSTASATITGVGTQFTSQLIIGSQIYDRTGTILLGTVLAIGSNTSLTLTSNALATVSGTPYGSPTIPSIGGAPIVSLITGGPTAFTVTVSGYTGTGILGLNYVDNDDGNEALDVAGNRTIKMIGNTNGSFTGQTYQIVLPEPTTHVSPPTATATALDNYSIKLDWIGTSTGATNYLIIARGLTDLDASGTYPGVADKTPVPDDFVFTDGNGAANISSALNTYTFTTLLSGKSYDFQIIPYALATNNSGDNIDFFTTGAPSVLATFSNTASASTLIAGTTSAPPTISSLTTAFQVGANYSFKIQDDGATAAIDNARTRFTQLVIKAGAGNTVTNWSDVIEEAQLKDLTEGGVMTTTTIGANSITFSAINTGDNQIGEVDDNELKEYELRIRLKDPMTGTAGQTVDNQSFDFLVNTLATNSFTYLTTPSQPSRVEGTQTINSGAGNTVDVIATQLTFLPAFGGVQPPSAALVQANLTVTPVARATDAKGNTDKNYVTNVTITNTGTLPMSTSLLTPVAGVVSFPGTFQYLDDGTGAANNGTLTLSSGILANGVSTNVTVNYTKTTTIIPGPHNEATPISSLITATPGTPVFDFIVQDDNLIAALTDGSPTRISQIEISQGTGNDIANWLEAIPVNGATLSDGTTTMNGVVSATKITFSGIDITTLGFITDNAPKTYTLNIWLNAAMGGVLPTTVDNLNLVFDVLDTDITLTNLSSEILPAESETSGATNNPIQVIATQLKFVTNPGPSLLVSKDISLQPPVPVIEALDANNNRDLNYNSTTVTTTNAGTLTMINTPASNSISAGIMTFPNNFQWTQIGDGTLTVESTGPSAVSNALSTPVTVRVGISGTITPGGTAEASTISSLIDTDPEKVELFDFIVNDDPGLPANDPENDGTPIQISQIRITQNPVPGTNTISNWSDAIAVAILSDGNPANDLMGTVNATDITFGSIPTPILNGVGQLGYVTDDNSKTYNLIVYLKSVMGGSLPTTIDGLRFGFEVLTSNITTLPTGTSIKPGESENSGTNSQVTVVATQLDYTSIPGAATINVPFTPVVVEARDENANRDLDFTNAITAFSNTDALVMINTPFTPDPILSFNTPSPGVLTFPATFQFTSTPGTPPTELSISAGGINNQISPSFGVVSSQESVVSHVSAAFQNRIPYINFQATDIPNSAGSFPLATFQLNDGDGVTPDDDGAPTTLQSIQFAITTTDSLLTTVNGSKDILQIALYDAAGNELDEVTLGAATTVTFNIASPINYITAPDNGVTTFTVRATFKNSSTNIQDFDNIRIQVINVVHGDGSEFNPVSSVTNGSWTQSTGAVTGADFTPANKNKINVVADRLDFTTPPDGFSGINEPFIDFTPVPIVMARDANLVLDLEHDFVGNLSTPSAGITPSSVSFVDGILNLQNVQYSSTGDGTITVMSNSLNSSAPPSIGCTPVEVNTVTTSIATGNVNVGTNLAGGSVNKVIFGVTISNPRTVALPSTQPLLQKFTISFSNPITSVFNNIRVFESTINTFTGGATNVVTNPTINASLVIGSNFVDIVFDPTKYRDLSAPNAALTYFLVVDVDPTASGSTPSIQPSVVDAGYTDPATDNNIITSEGSSYSSTFGQTYTFASIFPPTLVSSNPSAGQLNVNPNQPTIDLVFSVPVWTLDGKIRLHDSTNPNNPVVLDEINGLYPPPPAAPGLPTAGTPSIPLQFAIPGPLVPDRVYYITITPGVFDNNNFANSKGIMDQAGNLFGGITYSGTLYFKTANPTPPQMLTVATPGVTPASISNVTVSGATINATFSQKGKAYFAVVASGSAPAPTNAEIKGPSNPVGFVTRGSFNITQQQPISQFGVISAALNPSTTYDVWMYAENDALLTPFATTAPYGSVGNSHAVGAAGPTLSFTTPASAVFNVATPNTNICANSFQVLNNPFVISEGNTNDFPNTGGSAVTLNLLLPSGFQFDVSTTGTAPNYGTLTLIGTDFAVTQPAIPIKFINSSIVQISYANNNTLSRDQIILSGLRVISSSTTSGSITRLGGTALTGSIIDGTSFGTISSADAPGITFTNSYSEATFPGAAAIVTSIPDNFNEPSKTVQLTPQPPAGDYGPSSFSGQGVNVNQLSLTAVTIGQPFNITVLHTDNNGCNSQFFEQYTVYDHNTAIRIDGTTLPPYCSVNTNFVVNQSNRPSFGIPSQQHTIKYNNVPSYYMIWDSLRVDTIPGSSLVANTIIKGPSWQSVIQNLLVRGTTAFNPPDKPVPSQTYYDFTFDEATILDANFLSGGVIPDVYSNFKSPATAQNNFFYNGGSLGMVVVTGYFQSIANAALRIPLKQNVEFFVPAVPIVEIGLGNRSFLDITDPLNPVGSGGPSNKGTPIYCEQGGLIVINGFPSAAAGASVGTFRLEDAATSTVLPNTGFVDNSNGTATLNPTLGNNNYNDIRIVYTYKEINSPCTSSGSQIIRITPNPIPDYTTSTLCEDITIDFTDESTIPSPFQITEWQWSFNDPNSLPAQNTDTNQNPTHTYNQPAIYSNVQLQVRSDFGCASVSPANQTLVIGATPVAKFTYSGVSKDIDFNSTSTVAAPPATIANVDWDFGDGNADIGNTVTHNYLSASPYNLPYVVTATATSSLGCISSRAEEVIVVDKIPITDASAYSEDFEANGDGGWKVYRGKKKGYTGAVSWIRGVLNPIAPVTTPNTSNVWATNLSGPYPSVEISHLYSPCFDMTGLLRPMISFDGLFRMPSADGVVLEYSIDNRNIADSLKAWTRVGDNATGVNWYNGAGLASKPGDQISGDYGWTGINLDWVESKHILDPVANEPQVVFRFALASATQNPGSDGFVMDNIRIGNRTRTILLEHFTNKSNTATPIGSPTVIIEKRESDKLKSLTSATGTVLVKINYHVGFPGADPFNLDNPAEPSARALYYNISETPITRLDGMPNITNTGKYYSEWGDQQYSTQTLKLAESNIGLTTTENPDGSISVSVDVTPVVYLDTLTVLHVAILEKNVDFVNSPKLSMIKTGETDFEYVLKNMLPSALGTKFATPLDVAQTRNFNLTWYPDPTKLYDLPNDIVVIAFLQNVITREIYQAEILENISDPPLVTGLNFESFVSQIGIYPNPADREIKVILPSPATKQIQIQMIDQMGRIVNTSAIEKGKLEKDIDTRDMAAGIYLVQFGSGSSSFYKKVMVVHRN